MAQIADFGAPKPCSEDGWEVAQMAQCVECRRELPDYQVRFGICNECFNESAVDQETALKRKAEKVILSTSIDVPGREVADCIGLVSSEAAFAQGIIKDIGNSWRDFLGGKSSNVQQAIRQVRETCLLQLKTEAARLKADAVVAVQISYNDINTPSAGGILFMAATGTAVRLTSKS